MYHGPKTEIGRFLINGKGGSKVSRFLREIDVQKAQEIDNELLADEFYSKANSLTNAHKSRLKLFRRRLQKSIRGNRFPDKLTRFGNVIEEFSLPDIGVFFQMNKESRVIMQSAYFAVLSNEKELTISSYCEGDVQQISCKNITTFNSELLWQTACD